MKKTLYTLAFSALSFIPACSNREDIRLLKENTARLEKRLGEIEAEMHVYNKQSQDDIEQVVRMFYEGGCDQDNDFVSPEDINKDSEVDVVYLHNSHTAHLHGEPSLVAPEYKSQYPNADLLSPRLRKYLTNAKREKDKYQETVTKQRKKFK